MSTNNDQDQPTAPAVTPRSLVLSVALSEQDQDAISKFIMDYERELAALRQWSGQAREAMQSVIHFCDLPSARDRLTTLLATHPAIDSVMKQEGRE